MFKLIIIKKVKLNQNLQTHMNYPYYITCYNSLFHVITDGRRTRVLKRKVDLYDF